MQVEPISDQFGAYVTDLDVSALSATEFNAVLSAWYTYGVLVFRGQDIDDDAQRGFTRRFGREERGLTRRSRAGAARIANVNRDGELLEFATLARRFSIGNSVWHTDSSYKRVAAKASILSARAVPQTEGQTEWTDMQAGYSALTDDMKNYLADKIAVHNYSFSHAWHGGLDFVAAEDRVANLPPVLHRLVKRHPATGRKILFAGRHASHIVGEDLSSSRKLLRELTHEAAQPPRIWSHQWQLNDLALWDNRRVLHRARPYPADQRRILVRTTVAGDGEGNEWAD